MKIVLSTKRINKNIDEYVIRDTETATIGTYRLNSHYGMIVGRNSFGISNLDIFLYTKNDEGEIVDSKTSEIIVAPAKCRMTHNGYVEVYSDSLAKWNYAQRIVGFCYCDYDFNSKVRLQVDHISGDKEDNRPENLEYVLPIINKYRAAVNKYSGSAKRFVESLKKIFDEETDENIEYAVKKLIEELER